MMMLVMLALVIIVAATATVTTVVVMNAMQSRGQLPQGRPALGPPAGWSGPPVQAGSPGYRVSAADRERILMLLKAGHKIHAIKLYREVTGAGLRDAKDAVERLERYQ